MVECKNIRTSLFRFNPRFHFRMYDKSQSNWTIITFLFALFQKDQYKSTIAILYVCIAASVWKGFTISQTEFHSLHERFSSLFPYANAVDFLIGTHRIVGAFLLFGVIPALIVRYVFHEKLSQYGVCLGNLKIGLRSFLIMSPILFVIGYFTGGDKAYLGVYPLNPSIRPGADVYLFAAHVLTYVLYYIGWEFMFRGFLQKATEPQFGPMSAVLIQTLASTMLHYGHPNGEVFGAIVIGIFWGFLVLKTNSIWSGLCQHIVVGVSLDCFLIYR